MEAGPRDSDPSEHDTGLLQIAAQSVVGQSIAMHPAISAVPRPLTRQRATRDLGRGDSAGGDGLVGESATAFFQEAEGDQAGPASQTDGRHADQEIARALTEGSQKCYTYLSQISSAIPLDDLQPRRQLRGKQVPNATPLEEPQPRRRLRGKQPHAPLLDIPLEGDNPGLETAMASPPWPPPARRPAPAGTLIANGSDAARFALGASSAPRLPVRCSVSSIPGLTSA